MSSLLETPLCRYSFDALDRLIRLDPTGSPQHQRLYCKSRLVTEIQGALEQTIIQHGALLLAQQQRQGVMYETTLLATDQRCSVLHALKSHQGKPIAYSPYGHRKAEGGLLSLLGFNGERPDPVTGHYLLGNGYRAFSPVLMRFNSPDSLSPFGEGGLNSYAYCLGDPVNHRDPTGQSISFHWALVRNNLKNLSLQTRPIPWPGTNGLMRLDTPPLSSRPVAIVNPVQATPPASRAPAFQTTIPPLRRSGNTISNEYSRFIGGTPQSPDALAQMNPAMSVAMRNADVSSRIAVVRPTPIEDTARLTAMAGYTNMRGIGITSFPRATQLADQNRRAFDIRRRNDQRMEANPLQENGFNYSVNGQYFEF